MTFLKRIVEEILLYEGLEMTHEMGQSITHLQRRWSFDGHVSYEPSQPEEKSIKVIFRKSINKQDFINLIEHIGNFLGYTPTHIATSKSNYKFSYDEAIKNLGKYFAIYFDAKYDQEIGANKLPELLYHISSSNNEEKILKIGLVPKAKDKLSTHPSRIYLGLSKKSVEGLIKDRNFANNNVNFSLFEINLGELRKVRKIRFFEDPIYVGKGVYTYENIPPQFLRVIEKITL